PGALTSVSICALTLIFADDKLPTPWVSAESFRRALRLVLPLVVVTLIFGLSRLAFADAVNLGPKVGLVRIRAYWLVLYGLIGLFTLRGVSSDLHAVLTFGSNVGFETTALKLYVMFWLIAGVLAALMCFWSAKKAGTRLVLGFLTIHLAALTIAGGM